MPAPLRRNAAGIWGAMTLGDILTPDSIVADLQATNRWEAIDELIRCLVAAGRIKPEHLEAVRAVVQRRERSMSTGIGFGIGIPHASTDLIQEVVGAFGRSKTGIDFEALDNQRVTLVVLFLVPLGQFQKHLHTLADIAKLLHQRELRQALEQAPDDAAIYETLRKSAPARCGPCAPAGCPFMLHRLLESRLQAAVAAVLPDADPALVQVRPCADPKFGDYQSNVLMSLAKARGQNPRVLAAAVVAKLEVSDLCALVEVAGPGFLNFHLRPEALAAALQAAARGEHLFFRPAAVPRTVVVDFSSPNVAKPMHVGHIRSTILGDCLARVLRLLGHRVITDNHLGDWGTQFGKLIVGWKRHRDDAALARDPVGEMERLYRLVNQACETDPAVLEAARQELVKLQQGDPENRAIWQRMLELSREQFDAIYRRLGVRFDHTLGESFYNPRLRAVVEELVARGLAL